MEFHKDNLIDFLNLDHVLLNNTKSLIALYIQGHTKS